MNCRRVEELIPLYVEDDLDEAVRRGVSFHIDGCEGCMKLLDEYRKSQSWLRSQTVPEFDSAFFVELQRGVLQEIEREASRWSFWKRLFGGRLQPVLTTAMALLLLGAIAIIVYTIKRPNEASQIAGDLNREEPPARDEKFVQGGAPVLPGRKIIASKSRRDFHNLRRAVHMPHEKKPDDKLPAVNEIEPSSIAENAAKTDTVNGVASTSATAPEMTRIEFQTNDPKIRIIWFVPKLADSERSKEFPKIDTE